MVYLYIYIGVSENSVPLNPMVNDHNESLSLLNGYFIGNIPYFRQTHMCSYIETDKTGGHHLVALKKSPLFSPSLGG